MKSVLSQTRVAFVIALAVALKRMLTSINLDYQPVFEAGEVNDETIDGYLSSEMKLLSAELTQLDPYPHFLWRHPGAKRPCSLQGDG